MKKESFQTSGILWDETLELSNSGHAYRKLKWLELMGKISVEKGHTQTEESTELSCQSVLVNNKL